MIVSTKVGGENNIAYVGFWRIYKNETIPSSPLGINGQSCGLLVCVVFCGAMEDKVRV